MKLNAKSASHLLLEASRAGDKRHVTQVPNEDMPHAGMSGHSIGTLEKMKCPRLKIGEKGQNKQEMEDCGLWSLSFTIGFFSKKHMNSWGKGGSSIFSIFPECYPAPPTYP